MNQEEASELINRYVNGTSTISENRLIEAWYDAMSENRKLSEENDFDHLSEELWTKTIERAKINRQKKKIRLWPLVAAAGAIAACLILILYYAFPERPKEDATVKNIALVDKILPGTNKAMLTLSNGSRINLTDGENGNLAEENQVVIKKTADGQVIYSAAEKTSAVVFNTITTPRGGQYAIVLSDGTKVFLNAQSSITFPTSFSGAERLVKINGEAYLEVAHNRSMPFRVESKGQMVEVLGTYFNINSYDDEPFVRTTLLKGSVKVQSGPIKVLLKPGEQSQLNKAENGSKISVRTVNLEEVIAWKNGIFEFDEASIKDVMRSTARWYDINVTYIGKAPEIRISGKISRKVSFSGLIELLEFEGIRFRIDGKNIAIVN